MQIWPTWWLTCARSAARRVRRRHQSGTGLVGSYFNNTTLSGTAVLVRTEAVNFNWGTGSPGAGVNADNFSVRWTGTVAAAASGNYRFQTNSDDGVRVGSTAYR